MPALYSVVRDAPFGQLVRLVTKNKYFKYQEELEGFEIPWQKAIKEEKERAIEQSSPLSTPADDIEKSIGDAINAPAAGPHHDQHDLEALRQMATVRSIRTIDRANKTLTRESTKPWTRERFEAEQEEQAERAQSAIIVPVKTAEGITLVDWYSTTDEENPQNWSSGRKALVTAIIFFYTFVAYAASAIYTPSTEGVMHRFNVSLTAASLGLSLYVLGYGTGPMLFSPLSEIPIIGRNPPYIITFGLFTILAVPTALVDNFAGLLVLRFITGFMSSPALATGGATMQDMYSLLKLPYALTVWVAAAFSAPALGPLLSGFAVMNKNWRWSLWEILWMAGPMWLVMFFFMPETSAGTILLRRAQRLRKLTGDANLKSQSEIDQGTKSFAAVAAEAIWMPIEICMKDPAVLFTNIYTSCIYGIYYSFFEVFPLVYIGIYGFNIGTLGIVFLVIIIGCVIGLAIYVGYNWFYLEPDIKKNGLREQEHRLVPALFAVILLPAGMFWFGWTSESSIHWIVPTIGLTLFPIGAFILFQCIFMYLPLTYPQYAASLFAANDLCRSAFAAGAILYAHPLYINLGIGKGISVLAGLLCGGIFGVWALWWYGGRLRASSKFAQA
ncbi:hypothetical protein PMZ80_009199 [Knufia obscura]|uniref:Major facilitator superfamily (MFS) profile domain-containing protein n=2 Tax=Knufia TaxID=430999 RepID=A0AAN8EA79_9EURO|nr:hypothetical protein PMZ80_009199 [Knufia obscura]KAK5949060.1 hypothetical protein OHC33_009981 [Knufia fluminis]